jgi:hypothetical protein
MTWRPVKSRKQSGDLRGIVSPPNTSSDHRDNIRELDISLFTQIPNTPLLCQKCCCGNRVWCKLKEEAEMDAKGYVPAWARPGVRRPKAMENPRHLCCRSLWMPSPYRIIFPVKSIIKVGTRSKTIGTSGMVIFLS